MLALLSTVALIHFIALMTPGPDFFFVSQVAASRSRRDGMKAVLGICLGVVIWSGVALLGLHLILQKMAWLHQGIMIAGGLYLSYLGYQLLKSAKNHSIANLPTQLPLSHSKHLFMKGLLTNLANPKAIIYFGSVFSLFVGDDMSATARWSVFALVAVETLIWFSMVAAIFSLPAFRKGYQRAAKWIDGVAGTLFVAFGLHLIFSK
ncbi:threonine export protein RhtC [Neisseriaceae bacterium CLB008]|nr:threonine export protein RhtC [Neisseriaceae bacterium]